jgi:hypothetical protein
MFYRKVLDDIKRWKDSPFRKVLVLRGARQVGKTTAVRMAAKEFDTFIELNLEISEDKEIFQHFSNIEDLYNQILLRKNVKKKGKKILIFLDEVQNSPGAMRSLRFFYEQLPELYVIASGSLLDLYLFREKIEIAVGRVEYLWMYPMTFEEFLLASEQDELLNLLMKSPIPDYVYSIVRKQFLYYALIGGMPEAIQIWLATKDIIKIQEYHSALWQSFRDDVLKYAQTSEQAAVIRHIMDTAFSEVGKQISFEGFGASGYRSQAIKNAFQILERSALFTLLYPYTSQTLPTLPNKTKRPKLQFLDIGLLNFQAKVMADYFSVENLHSIYKGIAMEQVVGQMLTAMKAKYGFELAFWKRDARSSTAEVDYVLIYKGKMIPIEVKAGKTGSMKSLFLFMEEAPLDLAVRIYDGGFSIDELSCPSGKRFRLLNLPLALTFRLLDFWEELQ